MSDQSPIPESLSEDQVLAYTQTKRKAIVQELTKSGAVPEDNSSRNMLLQALDGMDRAALTSKRIKAEEKGNSALAGAAGIVAAMLNQVSGKRLVSMEDPVDVESRPAPALGMDVPPPQLVPGETEINPGQLDFDTFVASRGAAQSSDQSSPPSL